MDNRAPLWQSVAVTRALKNLSLRPNQKCQFGSVTPYDNKHRALPLGRNRRTVSNALCFTPLECSCPCKPYSSVCLIIFLILSACIYCLYTIYNFKNYLVFILLKWIVVSPARYFSAHIHKCKASQAVVTCER